MTKEQFKSDVISSMRSIILTNYPLVTPYVPGVGITKIGESITFADNTVATLLDALWISTTKPDTCEDVNKLINDVATGCITAIMSDYSPTKELNMFFTIADERETLDSYFIQVAFVKSNKVIVPDLVITI